MTAPPPTPIVLDCDPGHDDAIAMILAAAHPAVDLRAITTVAGNGGLDAVTHNARAVATLAGIRDVPIAAGADGPLAGTPHEAAVDIHGESGLDGPPLPEPAVDLDPRGATQLIADVCAEASEPVTLVATGPLTNVALALDTVPREQVREIVWMGGSTDRGNRTPYAEFNALSDPEAIDAVLRSGIPFTMLGLNLTHQALATPAVVGEIAALDTPLARTVAEWLGFFGDTYRTVFGMEAPPVHDPCAVALLCEPGVVRTVDAFLAVELEGRWTRGATVADLHGRLGHAPNAHVATELDAPRFWALVTDAVRALG